MRVSEYHDFVRSTDQYADRPPEERRLIALYGIIGEIGSLGSAIKKQVLGEGGEEDKGANEEIIEELGDTLWYCFSLAQIENGGESFNILLNDLEELSQEISAPGARAETIRATLSTKHKTAFLDAFAARPNVADMTFDEYQTLAFLTARTQGRELIGVCVAVLWRLGAELLRMTLPEIEISLNRSDDERSVNTVLGKIIWHLSALASVLGVTLDRVTATNHDKVNFRANHDKPTPHHDADREDFERLPRKFEVSFVSIQKDRSRMYLGGRQLGDDLTDNYREDDGYRFHDVMHLANVAHLGWSPVLRKLMGKKRKSRNDRADEVEDGARALIVEELILKAIHSEGVRLAKDSSQSGAEGPIRTFPAKGLITFKLLKNLRNYVAGLEVWNNQYWEWENAIFCGSYIYYQLRLEQQGTVTIDMDARTISYSPDVFPDLRGASVGLGLGRAPAEGFSAAADEVLTGADKAWAQTSGGFARAVSAKRAICAALKVPDGAWKDLDVKVLPDNRVCVRARGAVRARMWQLGAISFQLAFAASAGAIDCTAIAIGALADLQ
jgi:NTP pyrophosphatase (non-canonical NTP hydrolase)